MQVFEGVSGEGSEWQGHSELGQQHLVGSQVWAMRQTQGLDAALA